jgi:hypothetical protein
MQYSFVSVLRSAASRGSHSGCRSVARRGSHLGFRSGARRGSHLGFRSVARRRIPSEEQSVCNQESGVVDPDSDPVRIRNFVSFEDPDLEKSSNSNVYYNSWNPRNANGSNKIDHSGVSSNSICSRNIFGTLATAGMSAIMGHQQHQRRKKSAYQDSKKMSFFSTKQIKNENLGNINF